MLLLSLALAHGQTSDSIVSNEVGMVASNHPLASLAGIQVLLEGGNAVDAAIGTAAALGVVEPYSSGLGGDGFMMIRPAGGDAVFTLNFSGRAPTAVGLDDFQDGLPSHGPTSVTVPGAAAGWGEAYERFGTVSREVILGPAIEYARHGYRLSEYGAQAQSWASAQFLDWGAVGAETWWGDELQPPGPGDRVTNVALADTYDALVSDGFKSLYDGPLAEELVTAVRDAGGVLALEDLRTFEAQWQNPIRVTYRDHEVHLPPPNSSGGLAIAQVLNVLETFDPETLAEEEADFIHLTVEAIKLAAADRAAWVGDPKTTDIPLDRLVSKEYAEQRSASIDPERAAVEVQRGIEQPGTSHVSIVDRHGNMVSMTVSLGFGWGSGFVAGDTGLVLNNGLQMFDIEPESPAALEGGKRGRWNMAPLLITREGRPLLAIGTPGGTAIWQVLPQILIRHFDLGQGLGEAVAAPRASWRLNGTSVAIESRFDEPTLATLEERGHSLQPLGPFSLSLGGVAAVMIDPDSGSLIGVSDPRREGYAMGW